jgi:membrane-associated phospholipid phosphatase
VDLTRQPLPLSLWQGFLFLEQKLFYWINGLPHPWWADRLSLIFDCGGSIKILLGLAFLVAVLLFLMGRIQNKKEICRGAVLLVLSILLTALTVFFLKDWIVRPRPYIVFSNVYSIGGHASESSFPSGHAALFAVVGIFMIFYFKKWRVFWLAVVLLSGFTRVYQGLHYPGDVLAGWGVGFLFARILSLLNSKNHLKFIE